MSNFSGHVKKNARSFVPRGNGSEDVVVVKTAAGGYEQGGVQYFEPAKKADSSPTLPTTATPPTDGRGESELGLGGQVSHGNNDGSTRYLLETIKRVYRQSLAGRNAETLSLEERRALRDQIVDGVGSYGQGAAQQAVYELASLLAGLEEELSNTPEFLRAPKQPSPDSDRVGRFGTDYLRLKAEPTGTLLKSFGQGVTVYCRILHKNDALREVHGVIAEEAPDKSGEILDYDSSEPFFKQWSASALARTEAAGTDRSFGNVREQHSPRAVGKLTSIEFDSANKRIPVVAKIVDDDCWRKIQTGVLTGFSIGGSYMHKWSDGNYTRYTAKPAEVSIVDNPCMPGATFSMVKDAPSADGWDAIRARIEALSKRVDEMLKAQGVTSPELSPTNFKNVYEWREAIAKAELAKALANGKPAQFEGGNVKSGFRPLDTGEAPSGAAKTHYADIERKPFQPR